MASNTSRSSSAEARSPLTSSPPSAMPLILLSQASGEPETQTSASPLRREEQETTTPSSRQTRTPAKIGELPPCTSTASCAGFRRSVAPSAASELDRRRGARASWPSARWYLHWLLSPMENQTTSLRAQRGGRP